jgi:hypothetical protein
VFPSALCPRAHLPALLAGLLALAFLAVPIGLPAAAQPLRQDPPGLATAPGGIDIEWHRVGADGKVEVLLYYFWSRTCSHCEEAKPHIDALVAARPWLKLVPYEVSNLGNVVRYLQMSEALGQKMGGVPAFFLCGKMAIGWDGPEGRGAWLAALADYCRLSLQQAQPLGSVEPSRAPPTLRLPVLGETSAAAFSLPVLTLVLGGLDAFNPCAFFVLLFLLSLLVHAQSRVRMLLIGGTFVLFSGLIYFAFMAAWLNLFLLMSSLGWVTVGAALLALGAGALNVKDYAFPGRGPSLSMPEGARPGLFARMRGLLSAEHLPAMLAGTVVLAVTANAYELLCTSGFPMVYTRVLTLRELPLAGYYGWLAAYNVIYVLPLALIVGTFVWTLGRHKLTEREGRLLKLTSGLMMLGLGAVLLAAPHLLESPLVAAALLVLALGGALLAGWLERHYRPPGRV